MKVLFVGEGPHDIGAPEFALRPGPAVGVIPILARKVAPEIGDESLGLFWREIPLLNPEKRKKGLAAKVEAAILLAARHLCHGTICVTDQDGDEDRLSAMEAGIQPGLDIVGKDHRAVCGVAAQSIEAWILGAPAAIATVLGVSSDAILQEYKPTAVEELNQNSGKPEKRPKDLIARFAKFKHRNDGADFREEIANAADPDEISRNCPEGFKPFGEKLKSAFGPPSP